MQSFDYNVSSTLFGNLRIENKRTRSVSCRPSLPVCACRSRFCLYFVVLVLCPGEFVFWNWQRSMIVLWLMSCSTSSFRVFHLLRLLLHTKPRGILIDILEETEEGDHFLQRERSDEAAGGVLLLILLFFSSHTRIQIFTQIFWICLSWRLEIKKKLKRFQFNWWWGLLCRNGGVEPVSSLRPSVCLCVCVSVECCKAPSGTAGRLHTFSCLGKDVELTFGWGPWTEPVGRQAIKPPSLYSSHSQQWERSGESIVGRSSRMLLFFFRFPKILPPAPFLLRCRTVIRSQPLTLLARLCLCI